MLGKIPLAVPHGLFPGTAANRVRRAIPANAVRKAIDVEQLLIWAYQRQLVAGNGIRCDGEPARPEGNGRQTKPSRVDEDAITVAQTVDHSGYHGILADHARSGSRPDWRPTARWRLLPLEGTIEHPRYDYRPGEKRPYYCCLRQVDSPEVVNLARQDYETWHMALVLVRDLLVERGRLRDWHPVGPLAHPEPWADPLERMKAAIRVMRIGP